MFHVKDAHSHSGGADLEAKKTQKENCVQEYRYGRLTTIQRILRRPEYSI